MITAGHEPPPRACVVAGESFGQHPAEEAEQFLPLNRQEVVPAGRQRGGAGWLRARGARRRKGVEACCRSSVGREPSLAPAGQIP